jgi:hypothetical protein
VEAVDGVRQECKMKRSEVIAEIAELISVVRYEDIINKSCGASIVDAKEYAEIILSKLERLGLKPPLTKRCPVLLTNIHTWQKEEDNA